ncbi:hypothetical protein GIB67_040822, partial [Kingdonia uniflora]
GSDTSSWSKLDLHLLEFWLSLWSKQRSTQKRINLKRITRSITLNARNDPTKVGQTLTLKSMQNKIKAIRTQNMR